MNNIRPQLPKIAVFASGFGSNFQAIIDAIKNGVLMAEIVCLVTDKPESYSVQRAIKEGIDIIAFSAKNYASKADYEKMIAAQLIAKGVELIVLAGYMRIIGNTLLTMFPRKIINIHPALLPAFPGAHGIKDAFEYGVKVFGVTIHYVDSGIDTGEIIDQASFHINGTETIDEVETEIHAIEHKLYPATIQKLLEDNNL